MSQSGRFLRHYLYSGLNLDEAGRRVFDGINIHVAGARRGEFNHRYAQPSQQHTPNFGHLAPFADDPGADGPGLLDRQRLLGGVPKIITTNTSAEYWRGDCGLLHIDARGKEDLPDSAETRTYLLASTQHGLGTVPLADYNPNDGARGEHPFNAVDYAPLMRAALANLDAWVTAGVEPPPSVVPRLADGTAIHHEQVFDAYRALPGATIPDTDILPRLRRFDLGPEAAQGVGRYPATPGDLYPAFVSAVDADGNELGGLRMPDVAVPIATYTGWNPRHLVTGGPGQIIPMQGSTLPFARTLAEREASGDRRLSVAERYRGREDTWRRCALRPRLGGAAVYVGGGYRPGRRVGGGAVRCAGGSVASASGESEVTHSTDLTSDRLSYLTRGHRAPLAETQPGALRLRCKYPRRPWLKFRVRGGAGIAHQRRQAEDGGEDDTGQAEEDTDKRERDPGLPGERGHAHGEPGQRAAEPEQCHEPHPRRRKWRCVQVGEIGDAQRSPRPLLPPGQPFRAAPNGPPNGPSCLHMVAKKSLPYLLGWYTGITENVKARRGRDPPMCCLGPFHKGQGWCFHHPSYLCGTLNPKQSIYASSSLAMCRDAGGALGDADAGGAHGFDLLGGGAGAAGDDRAGVAHALAGGAVCPAMKPTIGLVTFALMNAAASSSSVPPISPIITIASVSGSSWNTCSTSMKVVPMTGSPPMPTAVDWPRPICVSA